MIFLFFSSFVVFEEKRRHLREREAGPGRGGQSETGTDRAAECDGGRRRTESKRGVAWCSHGGGTAAVSLSESAVGGVGADEEDQFRSSFLHLLRRLHANHNKH